MSLTLLETQSMVDLGSPSRDPVRLAFKLETQSAQDIRQFWFHLMGGELQLSIHFTTNDRVCLAAESRPSDEVEQARLSEREVSVFSRVLGGHAQKAIAYELHLCPSTIATHAARAFAKLNLPASPCAVPLALVLIAQSAGGAIELSDSRVTTSSRDGRRHVVANLCRPSQDQLAQLTCAERAVAMALVDGQSKFDIARARCTSVHTIGRQVSSLFGKLNVKGRFDLIRRMSAPPHHPAMSCLSADLTDQRTKGASSSMA